MNGRQSYAKRDRHRLYERRKSQVAPEPFIAINNMKDKTIEVLNMLCLAIIAGSLLSIALYLTWFRPAVIEIKKSDAEYQKDSIELMHMHEHVLTAP